MNTEAASNGPKKPGVEGADTANAMMDCSSKAPENGTSMPKVLKPNQKPHALNSHRTIVCADAAVISHGERRTVSPERNASSESTTGRRNDIGRNRATYFSTKTTVRFGKSTSDTPTTRPIRISTPSVCATAVHLAPRSGTSGRESVKKSSAMMP